MNTKIILSVLAILFLMGTADAQLNVHYININANGTESGNSWDDAYKNFHSIKWERGHTYYVASGNYNENVRIQITNTNDSWITIIKATELNNNQDDEWNPLYANGPAILNQLMILSEYIKVDGVTGENKENHGFKINYNGTGSAISLGRGCSFIHLHHIEVSGPGIRDTGCRGIYQNNLRDNVHGHHWSYLYIHDIPGNGITTGGIVGTSYEDYGILYENNILYKIGECTNHLLHTQGWQIGYGTNVTQKYWIIRNSQFLDITGTGNIVTLDYTINEDILIYNNIFACSNDSIYRSSPGVIYAHPASRIKNTKIFNNVFINIRLNQVRFDSYTNEGCEFKNNICYEGTYTTRNIGVIAESNAYYNCAGFIIDELNQQNELNDPFVDIENMNLRLINGSKSIGTGINLSNYFTTDVEGNPRLNNNWDMGIYNYNNTSIIPIVCENYTETIRYFNGTCINGVCVYESEIIPQKNTSEIILLIDEIILLLYELKMIV